MTAKWPASVLWGILGGTISVSPSVVRLGDHLPLNPFPFFILSGIFVWSSYESGEMHGAKCAESLIVMRGVLSFFPTLPNVPETRRYLKSLQPKKSPLEVNPCYNKKYGRFKRILLRYISIILLMLSSEWFKATPPNSYYAMKNKLSMEYLRQRSLMETV